MVLQVRARVETWAFAPGSFIVPLAQPLGTLAVYLLEPQSQDGLAAWNFFDDLISEGGEFPVMRVRSPHDLRERD